MAYIDFWRRWRVFSGRTSRAAYWTAVLVHFFLVFILLISAAVILSVASDMSVDEKIRCIKTGHAAFGLIWIVPVLSISVRRYRDAGYNKTNVWKLLIPGMLMLALLLPSYDTKYK